MATNFDDGNDGILSEINLTPLIDIMLVLLIIFMMTSSINLESGIDIDLPETTTSTSSQEGGAVLVSLDKMGNISVQGLKVTLTQLGKSIKDALKDSKSDLVVFEGDKASSLGKTIEIMDIARASGAAKFAIAAEQKDN